MTGAFHLTLPDGQLYSIQGPTRVGREHDCHIRLADSQVSRYHATLWVQTNALHIKDEGSANGTTVNGIRIEGPHRLRDGDRIQLGTTVLTAHTRAAAFSAPQAEAPKTPAIPPTAVPAPKPRRPWLWIGGLAVLGLIVVVGALIAFRLFLSTAGPGDSSPLTSDTPLVALAYSLDGGPQLLTAYIGRPARAEEAFSLPAGNYFIEAVAPDDQVHTLGVVTIPSGPAGEGVVDLTDLPAGQADPDYAGHLRTLADFLVANDALRLQYFELMSEGYTRPLYTRETELTPDEFAAFTTAFADLSDMEAEVLEAVVAFEAAAGEAGAPGARAHQLRVRPGLMKDIFDKFRDMFKSSEDLATSNLAYAAERMTPEQKEDAFQQISPGNRGNAENFDQLIQLLQDGDLADKSNDIQKQLYHSNDQFADFLGEKITAEFGEKAGNRPLLFIAHHEGGKALQAGGELYVSIVKEVLTAGVPGIEQGFEYADQANDWINYINNVYNDPLKTAGTTAADKIKGAIQEQIKNDLLSAFDVLEESEAEDLAGQLTDQMVTQLQQVGTQAAGGSDTTAASGGGSGPVDTSWIPGMVAEFLEDLVNDGTSADAAVNLANEMEKCLYEVMANGHPRSLAEELCLDNILALADPEPFVGSFYGPGCGEEYEFPYRWGASLLPAGLGQVAGSVRIHDCPGGGQAVYRVTGTVTEDATQITLNGTLQDAVGKIEETAPPSRTFTLNVSETPSLGW